MSFSCTIKAGDVDLTEWKTGVIHCQLLNLGPNGPSDDRFRVPYDVSDFRQVVSRCVYGDRLVAAARDCFVSLQAMAAANLDSLIEKPHCETCKCPRDVLNKVWAKELSKLIAIDPMTITYVQGGF